MLIENYNRTYEQNEFLGLNDLKTENYGEEQVVEEEIVVEENAVVAQ